jgi:hypothetical protein
VSGAEFTDCAEALRPVVEAFQAWAEAMCRVVADLPPDLVAVIRADASGDAMRLDASTAEAEAEMAEWRALLDGAKGRRDGA